ncbi:MAG: hypothetical protein LBT33_04155 [Spirochaetia bacterium]|jgi:hypothetical protein|nr:hypothetical protein [Spirochaetia bacterium]
MRIPVFPAAATGRAFPLGGRPFPAVAAAACILVFLIGMGASFFLPVFWGQPWRGYYTVLLDAKADIGEISKTLAGRGFGDFISAATATVEISDYGRMEELPLPDIQKRLPPGDPRLDAFLKGAPEIFRGVGQNASENAGESRHILYFPSAASPFALAWRLAPALDGYSWSIVEWHTGRRLVLLFLFCAIVAACVFFHPGLRPAALVLALPWLSFLVHGDPAVFAAGVFAYFALVHLTEKAVACFDGRLPPCGEGRPKSPLKDFLPRSADGAVPLAAAACLAGLSGGGMLPLVPLACGLAGSLALAFLLALHRRYACARREHRLFMPLPILPRKWKGKNRARADMAPLVLALCLMAVPPVFRASGAGAWLIPRPQEVPGISGFSRENLRRLWASGPDTGIPDFSDYLCHRAFQQGFFYGYPEELPLPDTRITLPRYREEGETIKRTEDTLLTFDEIWYNQELERAESPGLANLLLRQGAAKISLETAWRVRMDSAWVLRYTLIVALGLLVFVLLRAGLSLDSALCMKNFKIRRKRQEA